MSKTPTILRLPSGERERWLFSRPLTPADGGWLTLNDPLIGSPPVNVPPSPVAIFDNCGSNFVASEQHQRSSVGAATPQPVCFGFHSIADKKTTQFCFSLPPNLFPSFSLSLSSSPSLLFSIFQSFPDAGRLPGAVSGFQVAAKPVRLHPPTTVSRLQDGAAKDYLQTLKNNMNCEHVVARNSN